MKLLIGGDSEIGAATYDFLVKRGDAVSATTRRIETVSAERPFLDLGTLDAFQPPAGARTACLFAGWTRPADCEADPDGSGRINVEQSIALVERLLAQGLYVLFLSSNRVFDGSTRFVAADTQVSPICIYGRQKAQVEAAMLARLNRGAPLAIVRFTKVVSLKTPLIAGWIDALSCGDVVTAFRDVVTAPLPVDVVSQTISDLLREEARGIFQLSGPQDLPYIDIANYIAKKLDADADLVRTSSAKGASLPRGSIRRHTTLDSARLRELCGVVAPDAWTVIDRILAGHQALAAQ